MEMSFHYYGTYCAAQLAGYGHEESLQVAYSAQLVDWCSRAFLARIGGPASAATTQLKGEMAQARTDLLGLADITRIWASFHFLPRDLYAEVGKGGRAYRNKYRLICGPNGDLLADTVRLAEGKGLQAAGLAMHVLADTWAHRCFAGTPSLVINDTNRFFVELVPEGETGTLVERPVRFRHSLSAPDDLDGGVYTNTMIRPSENAIMNLGHGRAGHLPDYSFARYRYVPAWADYEEVAKDNPTEYYQAFCQMVYALRCLRGEGGFECDRYATDVVAPYEGRIREILERRQLDDGACADWRALGESLSGERIPDFDLETYEREFVEAEGDARNDTFLGRFILAALAQKGMVVNRVFSSGNRLAGRSIDYDEKGFAGVRDFLLLVEYLGDGGQLG